MNQEKNRSTYFQKLSLSGGIFEDLGEMHEIQKNP